MQIQDGKYLTFSLGRENYGIPILQVREIIRIMDITSIPKTPEYIRGVINLRGKIIPIMDLRTKFGMDVQEYTERTCIIVVEVNINEFNRQMGVIVDMVSEVVNIDENEIETTLDYGTNVDGDFLNGLGKLKDKVVMLLDIEKIVNTNELVSLMKDNKEILSNV